MCEGRITLEEAKLMMADLTARKKAKQPKKTVEQWLSQYKTCSRCKFQATCHHNPVQWVEEWADAEAKEFRPKVNRSLTTGQYNACCKWDGDTLMSLMQSLEKAKKRGEVVA